MALPSDWPARLLLYEDENIFSSSLQWKKTYSKKQKFKHRDSGDQNAMHVVLISATSHNIDLHSTNAIYPTDRHKHADCVWFWMTSIEIVEPHWWCAFSKRVVNSMIFTLQKAFKIIPMQSSPLILLCHSPTRLLAMSWTYAALLLTIRSIEYPKLGWTERWQKLSGRWRTVILKTLDIFL